MQEHCAGAGADREAPKERGPRLGGQIPQDRGHPATVFASRRHGRQGGLSSAESTIVSEGFKGGTRGAPIMPRDVSLSDSKCWN